MCASRFRSGRFDRMFARTSTRRRNLQPALTTTAQVLHDIGLAAGFGGSLFGKLSLSPAVRAIDDKAQRGKVLEEAWSGQKWVNVLSLGAAALTWFTGRSAISGRSLGKDARAAVVAKDVLVGVYAASTIGSMILGAYLGSGSQGYVPVEQGGAPAAETPPEKAKALKALRVLGTINLFSMAAVIGVTAFLNQRAASSARWKVISRFLP
jgi:hypothetical protein